MRVERIFLCLIGVLAGLSLLGSGCGGSSYDPGETTAEACQDGSDNDGDGQADCEDSDCAGFLFCAPVRENTAAACQDGSDNDGDGDVDCDDSECADLISCAPPTEQTVVDCQDGSDNDGDSQVDCADDDCGGFVFCSGGGEQDSDTCQNGVDDDEDELTDCADPGCAGFIFCAPVTESSPDACRDFVDNDGDGRIDCSDSDCQGYIFCAPDTEEDVDVCQNGIDDDHDGDTDCDDVGCAGFVFCAESSTAACQDTLDNDGDGQVDCADTDCLGYVFCFSTDETTAFGCQDGADNDGDGATDCDDPDCIGYVFCDPNSESSAAKCQDGSDNDNDGSVDCDDTDCQGFVFCQMDESTSAVCQDGADNDGDGSVDCDDTDCQGFVFCLSTETSAMTCQDGVDNDTDGQIDCDDIDCMGFVFCVAEETTSVTCQDGADNDGDGQVDCADTDCQGFVFCQSLENTVGACQDGADNDGDGQVDCVDADCQGYVFCLSTETTAGACQDGADNDSDGAVDCDDTDCQGFVFCFGAGEESSFDACQDGTDNDSDGDLDCDDPGCWLWGFCQHYQGYPVVDAWTETFDGIERPPLPWAEARAVCENLGGRLPTVTELWRNNASSGTGDLSDTAASNWLWTEIRDYRAGNRELVRLSDGTISYAAEATAYRFRCVWPNSDGLGFDAERCHGDPGDPCFAFDRVWNVDSQDRAPIDYVAAAHECSLLGGSIPAPPEWGRLIHAGLPNGTDQWNWASQAMYWYPNNYGKALVKWTDSQAENWHYINGACPGGCTAWGALSLGSDDRRFRCIGLAEPAAYSVPNPTCNGTCQQFDARRSTVIADDTDRVAVRMAAAVDDCRSVGADLPNMADAVELIQLGWAGGSSAWNWLTDSMYWWSGNYGYAVLRWSGDSNAHFYYVSGTATVVVSTENHEYRCIWHSQGPGLPACAADEIVEWDGSAFVCAAGADGDSNNNAYVVEVPDEFGNAWDGIQRNVATWADALATCESLGGRLPYANELYAVRASNNPHTPIGDINSTSYLWTMTSTYAAGNRTTVRISDGGATHYGEATTLYYRCIWPALHGDVLAANNCYGPPGDGCFSTADGLTTDKYDRVALPVAAAINECAQAGGYLPDQRQAIKLLHDGLPNGSDAWLWLANVVYWYSNNYGHSIFKWSGVGPADWEYNNPAGYGSLAWPSDYRPFRCVYDTVLR